MYYKNNYREASVHLVQTNSQGKYEVNEEAFKFIRNIPEPLAVISVAGLYRTGKSYLLNRVLLNRSDGFNVGPTVNACTKGLWVWGKPIIGRNKQNELVNVLIIDSEGFGAVTEDQNHDARIFALTLLLSSCFLYNSVGSIDEMAIENVSLVTNIAKSIRVRNDEVQQEGHEAADFFPQFYWVLRDFTLQLTSGSGQELTAKQYMERALEITSKDPTDEKSKTRKALTSYFPERDCITLVRPLTNEESLQELDKMEFQKLRPQFVQQVIIMRKKVLNSLAVKKFYGRAIDGDIFCQIVEKYVGAINQGGVPQIENIWSYISKNECEKASTEAMQCFEEHLNERILQRLPVSPEELEEAGRNLIKSVLAQFKKKVANFDGIKEFRKTLEDDMERRLKQVRTENEREAKKELERCIDLEFQAIDRKIKSCEFRSIGELLHEFEKQAKEFAKISPIKGALGTTILNEFLLRKTIQGAEALIKAKEAETEKSKTALKQIQKKTEADIKELRNELNSAKSAGMIKISKLETERSELISKEESMREALSELRSDKERLEQMIDSETRRDKSLSTKNFQDLRSKLSSYEARAEQSERKLYIATSESEKKEALLAQKIEFQERMLEQLKRKEEKSYEQMKALKENYARQIKEINARNESNSKGYQKKLADFTDKNIELENELHRLSELLKIEKELNDRLTTEQSLKQDELNRTINKITGELREKEMQYKNKLSERFNDDSKINERLAVLEETAREKDEAARQLKVDLGKEKALLAQKQEFYELELKELRRKYEEEVIKGDSMLRMLQSTESQKGEALNDIRSQYTRELEQLEKVSEAERRQLRNEVAMLSSRNEQAETKLRHELEEARQELALLTEKYHGLEESKNKMLEQNKIMDVEKMRNLKLLEDRNSATIKQLEREIEGLKDNNAQELRESQRRNEEALTQLKNFYEIEKERLEKKVLEYQQKCKDFSQLDSESMRYRFEEKCLEYEEQIQGLMTELRQARVETRNLENDYQCRLAVTTRQLDSLRQEKRQLRETLQTTRITLEEQFGQTLQNLREEKTELYARLEQLNLDLNKKDKDVFALTHKKEQLQATLQKRDQAIESTRLENESERKHYEFELDRLKEKAHKINDEYLSFKIQNEKLLALALQEKEFMSRRVNELQDEKERERVRSEQRLGNQLAKLVLVRSELASDYKEKSEKIMAEYGLLEQKFERVKKTWKDEETRLQKQISVLERDKSALSQRLGQLESSKEQDTASQLSQAEIFTTQISQLKEEFARDRQRLANDLQKQRYLCSQMEELKSEVEINYEKDRVLWANKLQFVETQRDQAKLDLAEALKKFETAMNHMSKNRPSEESFQDITKSIQRKYQWQIESLKETHEKKSQEAQERLKLVQNELKSLKEAYSELKNDKELQAQREKLQYMHISELSHLSILQSSSEQFEKERLEYEERLQRQKDDYARKMADLQRRNKEAQAKCSNVTFGFEKEYVKWNIDRKCLEDRIEELIDVNEKIYRELERYKNKDKEREKPSARRLFRLE